MLVKERLVVISKEAYGSMEVESFEMKTELGVNLLTYPCTVYFSASTKWA